MRIAMVSCLAYRDAWKPFKELLNKFWPEAKADIVDDSRNPGMPWCAVVAEYAWGREWPVLLMQEDFFINAPVNTQLVDHGLKILERVNVGAVRLYPCPGSNIETDDKYFGMVEPHTPYRTSCQATLWKPKYLHSIASRFNTPAEFELLGSSWASANLPDEVWAFKREVQPWPMEYYCSSISRGLWEPAALQFCKDQGIEVDLSLRGIRSSDS